MSSFVESEEPQTTTTEPIVEEDQHEQSQEPIIEEPESHEPIIDEPESHEPLIEEPTEPFAHLVEDADDAEEVSDHHCDPVETNEAEVIETFQSPTKPPLTPYNNGSPNTSPSRRRKSAVLEEHVYNRVISPGGDPSPSLLRTTAARVWDHEALEAHKKELTELPPSPLKKSNPAYTPSEHLLKTTQCRIADQKEWESHFDRVEKEKDIWWEKRKPAEIAKPRPELQSKLFAPTAAALHSKREKFQDPNSITPVKKERSFSKIDATSPLLKSTKAVEVQSWTNKDAVPAPVTGPLELPSQHTGPQNIPSKLNKSTKALEAAKWKSKEEIEAEEAAKLAAKHAEAKKVKEVSSRLTDFNAAMRHAKREKVIPEKDTEQGWDKHFIRNSIPSVEAVHAEFVAMKVSPRKSISLNSSNGSSGEPLAATATTATTSNQSVTNEVEIQEPKVVEPVKEQIADAQ